jgi:hypothetical protein
VPIGHYLVLSGLLFCIGAVGVFLRSNLITMLLSVEIMLNAVNLTFVAFGRQLGTVDGQIITVLRDDGRGRRSRGRPGAGDRAVPQPRIAQPRSVHDAQMVIRCWR